MKSPRASWIDFAAMALILAALIGLFGLTSRNFLSAATFSTLANRIPTLTVVAAAMTLVLMVRGIDLSVGSVMALAGTVAGVLVGDFGWNFGLAALAALAVGAACGAVNGGISVYLNVPSFIVTLGTLEAARGLAYLATDSQTKYLGAAVAPLSNPLWTAGVSAAFVIALIVVIKGQIVLSQAVAGRRLIAVGANEEAAFISGIDPRPLKFRVFLLSGALAGLGGVFYVSRLGAADPNAGIGLELSAIAAAVIGGTSLAGGRGSMINTFFGVLIIATLEAGLAQAGVSEPLKRVITGAVIVLAVLADAWRQRRR
ncbi:MAG: ABC transporter permease [Verrucomicrobiales bacterium]|nr:ABC transporter permease [Verrucomicrobiales bacterium]